MNENPWYLVGLPPATLVETVSIPLSFLAQAYGTRFELIFHFKHLFSFSVTVFRSYSNVWIVSF